MQLFTFGHPCEHQLRRVCIGGTSCPLNGYPDHWCCSFVKGRINFKRDKPCEGPRCRWGFAHPPVSSFDAVTLVLQEARAIAVKMEENYGQGTLHGGPYIITTPNIADVAHCALNFLRVPPARVATRIGGMLASASVKAADPKLFTQLLKTMKKPVDDYLIGAFEFMQFATKTPKGLSKDSLAALDDLRHDVITIMGSALSHQGALVNRPEQLPLQSYYIAALKTATKNKKKFTDALDLAAALFQEAVQLDVPALPESWTKTGKRDSETHSNEGGKTPEHKGTAVTPSVSPAKATVTEAQSVASDKATTPVQIDSKVSAPVAMPTQTLPPPLASAPKLPPAQSPIEPPTKAKSASAAAAISQPSLLATCQAMGGCELFDMNVFPTGCYDSKLPLSSSLLFGGLFRLDLDDALTMEMPESGNFTTPTSPTSAPLGAAIQAAHASQLWSRGPYFQGADLCTSAAERQAEISAAAAALRIVDFVLDA